MIKIVTITIMLCLALPTLALGQGETSNWYFGYGAGITFNNDGSVTALNDGKLNTKEGSATISDYAGNLLFYTDGITVYDQDHSIMENGNDLFGDSSSTQSAIIVPQPGRPNLFYIFTVDTSLSDNEDDRGLNYSKVDISQNGGKGAVVEKNIPLLEHSSEKLAAVVKNCSDQSIWLLTFASIDGKPTRFNTYHAFEITVSGISPSSVKSTFETLSIDEPRGYLKVSSDGTKIASANMANGLFLYDFDLNTGVVSDQQRISIWGPNPDAYGIEFSPNGRYLYAHTSKESSAELGLSSVLLQFDLEAVDITASQVILDDSPIFRGALQLGVNGKIYRTIANSFNEGTQFLGVINRPNEKGKEARYKHNAVSLGGNNASLGLPPFVQSFLNKTDLMTDANGNGVSSLALCIGQALKLEAESIQGADYAWEKDGVPFDHTGNIFEISTTKYSDAGGYRVTITPDDPLECPKIGDILVAVSPPPVSDTLFLTQCDIDVGNSIDGITSFDLTQADTNIDYDLIFYESVDSRSNNNPIPNPENYTNSQAFNQTIYYRAISDSGCDGLGEVFLEVHPTTINTSPLSPLMGCEVDASDNVLTGNFDLYNIEQNEYSDFEIAFYRSLEDVVLEENPLMENYISADTTIYIRLEKDGQCQGVERLELMVNPLPELQFETDYQVCSDGERLQLTAPVGYDSYTWYKIEGEQNVEVGNNSNVLITSGGNYSLEVGIQYGSEVQTAICTTTADFTVQQSNRAIFKEINLSDPSKNNSVEIIVSGDGDYEYSLDGLQYQNSERFENVDAGFYKVFVRDKKGCGVSEEDVAVIGFPKFFTPNGDGNNDLWQIIGADLSTEQAEIAIYDRYGKLMKQFGLNDPGWDGTFNGRSLPSSDFWFRVAFNNGKRFNGHFSLKR